MHLINQYVKSIYNKPLLSIEEEQELAYKIAQGCKSSLDRLIEANLRLVISIAQDYRGRGCPFEDLISEGNVGLHKAATKFLPGKVKFSTYAAWWIRQGMQIAITKKMPVVRLPQKQRLILSAINKINAERKSQGLRKPNIQELSKLIGHSERVIRNVLEKYNVKVYSLDAPLSTYDSGENFHNMVYNMADESLPGLDLKEFRIQLKRHLSSLTEEEKTVIEWRFGLNGKYVKTLQELADSMGKTRERYRQIQNKALKKLKKRIEQEGF